MFDVIGQILFHFNIAEFVFAIFVLLRHASSWNWRKFFRSLLLHAGIIFFTFTIWFSILVRDGLGPGAIETTGHKALMAIINGSGWFIITGTAILVISILVHSLLKKKYPAE